MRHDGGKGIHASLFTPLAFSSPARLSSLLQPKSPRHHKPYISHFQRQWYISCNLRLLKMVTITQSIFWREVEVLVCVRCFHAMNRVLYRVHYSEGADNAEDGGGALLLCSCLLLSPCFSLSLVLPSFALLLYRCLFLLVNVLVPSSLVIFVSSLAAVAFLVSSFSLFVPFFCYRYYSFCSFVYRRLLLLLLSFAFLLLVLTFVTFAIVSLLSLPICSWTVAVSPLALSLFLAVCLSFRSLLHVFLSFLPCLSVPWPSQPSLHLALLVSFCIIFWLSLFPSLHSS